MTPEEAYEKALEELLNIQFVDNTQSEGFAARREVNKLLTSFYLDMLQLLLEKQAKVVELDKQVIALQLENAELKSKNRNGQVVETTEEFNIKTLTLLNDMLMNGTPQEKEYATRKFDEWFTKNLRRSMESVFGVP